MEGTANYIGAGTLIITVDKFNGSGSHNSWAFAVSGEVGQTGATGASGVVSVTSPITNTGTSGSAIVGIDQTLLAVSQSQVTNLVSDLAGKASLGAANTFTVGGHVINTGTAATKGLTIKRVASQTANMLEFQLQDGTILSRVDSSGDIYVGLIKSSYQNQAFAGGAAIVPLLVRGAASQTADLLQIQNSTPTNLFSVSSAGLITAKVVSNAANQNRGLLLSNTSDTWQSGLYLKSDGSGNPRIALLAPTGALGEAVSIDSAAKVGIGSTAPTAQLDVYSGAAARIGMIVRGAASQSVDLQQWQASDGSTKSYIDSTGRVMSQTAGNFGGLSAGQAFLGVQTQAGVVGLLVKGAASQSADLLQIQNSGGTVQVKVDSGGYLSSIGYVLTLSQGSFERAFGGAMIGMAKTTSTVTNPGASMARLYFVDGTTTGTLKLVVKAGAAGAQTTILDNIPQ
jgi:hypothetical protein